MKLYKEKINLSEKDLREIMTKEQSHKGNEGDFLNPIAKEK